MNSQLKEKTLKEYLLGELDEKEQAIIEDELFISEDLLQRLELLESELVDDYVRKTLSKTEQKSFEKYFLATLEHQHKLKIALALDKYIDKNSKVRVKTKPFSFKELVISFFSFRSLIAATATILIIVLLVGIKVVLNENSRLREELAKRDLVKDKPSQELTNARLRNQELVKTIEDQNRLRKELEDKLEETSKTITPKNEIEQPAKFLAFMLNPGVLRDDSEVTKIKLSPEIKEIRLELALEIADYKGYQAELQDQDGNTILKQNKLKENKAKKTVLVKIQTKSLKKASYRIILQGIAEETSEKIGTYYFNLEK